MSLVFLRLVCVAGLLWLATGSGLGAVLLTTNYYHVSGQTAHELRQALNERQLPGTAFSTDGVTRWQLKWSYYMQSTGNGFRLRRFDTRTEATMTLPKWTNSMNAPAPLVKRWNEYLQALQTHEGGHVKVALDATAELRKRVKEIKEMSTAQDLEQAINDLGMAVIDEFHQKEIQYDRTTKHGFTQGAHFP